MPDAFQGRVGLASLAREERSLRLTPNRHERGWPKFQLLTFIAQYPSSERFCIEPMGQRDSVWERSGYVELIRWTPYTERNLPTG